MHSSWRTLLPPFRTERRLHAGDMKKAGRGRRGRRLPPSRFGKPHVGSPIRRQSDKDCPRSHIRCESHMPPCPLCHSESVSLHAHAHGRTYLNMCGMQHHLRSVSFSGKCRNFRTRAAPTLTSFSAAEFCRNDLWVLIHESNCDSATGALPILQQSEYKGSSTQGGKPYGRATIVAGRRSSGRVG